MEGEAAASLPVAHASDRRVGDGSAGSCIASDRTTGTGRQVPVARDRLMSGREQSPYAADGQEQLPAEHLPPLSVEPGRLAARKAIGACVGQDGAIPAAPLPGRADDRASCGAVTVVLRTGDAGPGRRRHRRREVQRVLRARVRGTAAADCDDRDASHYEPVVRQLTRTQEDRARNPSLEGPRTGPRTKDKASD